MTSASIGFRLVPAFPAVNAIVIGASAGGVDALLSILKSVPAHFKPAILVVLHLPPDRPSGLVALLSRRCALPVREALDKQPIEDGCVIVAPPNYHLLVEPELTVALSVDPPIRYSRPAIDPLFETASIAYGRRLLGVLLTGGSEDGSDGIAAIRHRGGIAWLQDPATAIAATMPAAALAKAGADEILTIEQICQRLAIA